MFKSIRKRDGKVVAFKVDKITNQIDYNRVAEAYMEMN